MRKDVYICVIVRPANIYINEKLGSWRIYTEARARAARGIGAVAGGYAAKLASQAGWKQKGKVGLGCDGSTLAAGQDP